MLRGPVRNLSLIYDAKAIYAEVRPVLGPDTVYTSTGKVGFLCLSGRVTIGGDKVPVGAFALGSGCEIQLDAAASGILVSLQDLALPSSRGVDQTAHGVSPSGDDLRAMNVLPILDLRPAS